MTKSNSPLYKQIYDSLKQKIDSDFYKVNEALPSEQELQTEYGVSRITVRRALNDLEIAGSVRRVHGKGTFVEPRKHYYNLAGASSFSDEAKKTGERASSIILEFKTIEASIVVAEYLQIPVGTDIYFLKRIRLKSGRIVGMNETYINKLNGLKIENYELDENTSIYNLYSTKGFEIARATETIEAKMPSKSIRNELYVKEDEPVFLRERITYLDTGEPIEYSINTYKANEYKYAINLVKG